MCIGVKMGLAIRWNPCSPCCVATTPTNNCCDFGDCIKITISEGSGCPCLDGFTMELSKTGDRKWEGTGTPPCGDDMSITIECLGTSECEDYYITIDWGSHGVIGPQQVDPGCTCSPILLTFTGLIFPTMGAECDGAIEIVIEPCDTPGTPCCGTSLPDTLYATITGNCSCMNKTITLTRTPTEPYGECVWLGGAPVNSQCSGCAAAFFDYICIALYDIGSPSTLDALRMTITIAGDSADCTLSPSGCGGVIGATPDSTNVSPLVVVYNRSSINSPCSDTYTVTITDV